MLKIVKDTAKSLHSRCAPVEDPRSPEIKATLDEMTKYLKDSQDPAFREKNPSVREGVGLAAPQVGINKRMLVIYYPSVSEEGKFVEYQLVNPLIVSQSIRQCYLESGEGCLSVNREVEGIVPRYARATFRAYDENGDEYTIRVREDISIAFQHEMDHLNGILFIDYIDPANPYKNKDYMREI